MTKRYLHADPIQKWTPEEDAVIRRLYPDSPACDLTVFLPGRTLASIYARAKKLRVQKSAAFYTSAVSGRTDGQRGASTRFTKGQKPWNTGTHFVAGGKAVAHQFKKGQRPKNAMAVGTRVKSFDGYWKEKVAEPNVWRFVHRMLWEDAHGPVPKGYMLCFRDGNPSHLALENLELVDRITHMKRHTIHNLPAPLPHLLQLKGALTRQINKRERAAHAE